MKITKKLTCWICVSLLGSMFLFNACSTDFEVNAPYDNMPVVYGLLNQNDTLHFVKINKTYLGEGNALLAAAVPDSSIYPNLTATIEEWIGGVYQRTFTLMDTVIPDRDPGLFYYPDHQLYYFYADDLSEDAEYRLMVNTNEQGKTAEATTIMVKDFNYHFSVENPLFTVDFHNGVDYRDYSVKWTAAENGKRHEVRMTFTYFDVTATDTVRRTNEWLLGEEFANDLTGTEELEKFVSGESFYALLETWVNSNDANDPAPGGAVLKRIIGNFTVEVTVAGDELDTYMQVNAPVTGLVTERPSYSNIAGGIGLFGSRYQKEVGSKKMGLKTVEWLCEGPTGGLLFCIDTPTTVWSTLSCHCNP